MAISYTRKTFTDTASSGNGLGASDLNRMETGISAVISDVNGLHTYSDPIKSKVFQNMTVEGIARAGVCTVHIYGEGVVTSDESNTVIAQLKKEFYPKIVFRSLFGINGNSWGILVINDDGTIRLTQRYSPNTVTWSMVDVTATFVY